MTETNVCQMNFTICNIDLNKCVPPAEEKTKCNECTYACDKVKVTLEHRHPLHAT